MLPSPSSARRWVWNMSVEKVVYEPISPVPARKSPLPVTLSSGQDPQRERAGDVDGQSPERERGRCEARDQLVDQETQKGARSAEQGQADPVERAHVAGLRARVVTACIAPRPATSDTRR